MPSLHCNSLRSSEELKERGDFLGALHAWHENQCLRHFDARIHDLQHTNRVPRRFSRLSRSCSHEVLASEQGIQRPALDERGRAQPTLCEALKEVLFEVNLLPGLETVLKRRMFRSLFELLLVLLLLLLTRE